LKKRGLLRAIELLEDEQGQDSESQELSKEIVAAIADAREVDHRVGADLEPGNQKKKNGG
jgi:hypothetical protein